MPVHYGGIGCEMDSIMELANKHNFCDRGCSPGGR